MQPIGSKGPGNQINDSDVPLNNLNNVSQNGVQDRQFWHYDPQYCPNGCIYTYGVHQLFEKYSIYDCPHQTSSIAATRGNSTAILQELANSTGLCYPPSPTNQQGLKVIEKPLGPANTDLPKEGTHPTPALTNAVGHQKNHSVPSPTMEQHVEIEKNPTSPYRQNPIVLLNQQPHGLYNYQVYTSFPQYLGLPSPQGIRPQGSVYDTAFFIHNHVISPAWSAVPVIRTTPPVAETDLRLLHQRSKTDTTITYVNGSMDQAHYIVTRRSRSVGATNVHSQLVKADSNCGDALVRSPSFASLNGVSSVNTNKAPSVDSVPVNPAKTRSSSNHRSFNVPVNRLTTPVNPTKEVALLHGPGILPPSKALCSFCKSMGKPDEVANGHVMKDLAGKNVCPFLRKMVCRFCGSVNEDTAHTQKYCPLKREHANSVLAADV